MSHTNIHYMHMYTLLLKCTDPRGAVAATHCHGLHRQIPHTLHCPSPACFPTLHSLFPPSLCLLSSLLQNRSPLMISIQSSSQAPSRVSTTSCRTMHYVALLCLPSSATEHRPCRCHVKQSPAVQLKWPCDLRRCVSCRFVR